MNKSGTLAFGDGWFSLGLDSSGNSQMTSYGNLTIKEGMGSSSIFIGEDGTGANIDVTATDYVNVYANGGVALKSDYGSIRLGTTSTTHMMIDTSGNVGIGTTSPSEKLQVNGNVLATSYLYTSDRRYKRDIEDINGLESILKLRGVHFRWKENGNPELGLIAQEVEKVLPELVVTNPVTGMKSVKYGNLVAPLIESVKELNRKISLLEEENAQIREENFLMKRQINQIQKENVLIKKALCEVNSKAEICWGQ